MLGYQIKLRSNIVCSKSHLQLFTNNENIVKKPPKLLGFKTRPRTEKKNLRKKHAGGKTSVNQKSSRCKGLSVRQKLGDTKLERGNV